MENQLIPYGDKQVTPRGYLFVEKHADSLYRVMKHRIKFIDGSTKEITYQQYEKLSAILTSANIPRFVQFDSDGEVIATAQIASVKPYETIINTCREDM